MDEEKECWVTDLENEVARLKEKSSTLEDQILEWRSFVTEKFSHLEGELRSLQKFVTENQHRVTETPPVVLPTKWEVVTDNMLGVMIPISGTIGFVMFCYAAFVLFIRLIYLK